MGGIQKIWGFLVLGASILAVNSCAGFKLGDTRPMGLFDYVSGNNTQKVREIYGFDIDANMRNKDGQTPLHIAASKDLSDIAALLLQRQANVNASDILGNTPLHLALTTDAFATATLLARSGADIFATNLEGLAPVDIAFAKGEATFASLVSPETIGRANADGITLLHYAARKGNPEMALVVLKAGASTRALDAKGLNPLDLALASGDGPGHARVAKLIIEAGSPAPKNLLYSYVATVWAPGASGAAGFEGGASALHLAAIRNHLGIAEVLIQGGAALESTDKGAATPLLRAAELGNARMVSLLASRGASVNARDVLEDSPIHKALLSPTIGETLAVLLNFKALPSTKNKAGDSPLHILVKNNLPVSHAKALLDAGADTSVRDAKGNSPLLLALVSKQKELAQAIVLAGGGIFDQNSKGESPLQQGVLQGPEMLAWLVPAKLIDASDGDGEGLLHYAVKSGEYIESLQFLINLGAKVNAANRFGQTPLHLAILGKQPKMMKSLILNSADIYQLDLQGRSPLDILFTQEIVIIEPFLVKDILDRRDSNGQTPLFYAVKLGRLDLVKAIMAKGVDLSYKNNVGATVLHQAVRFGQGTIMTELIRAGASPDHADALGNTSLHYMVQWSQQALADGLFAARSNLEAQNTLGRSPFHEAVRLGNYSLVSYLLNKGANVLSRDKDGRTPLFDALAQKDTKIIMLLLDQGRQVTQRDNNGNTVLHEAIRFANKDINDTLISRGSDLFAENAQGKTPIHLALEADLSALKALITRESINKVNNQGNSPLHLAANTETTTAHIDWLLSQGPDLNNRNKLGKTALDLAKENKREALVKKIESALVRP